MKIFGFTSDFKLRIRLNQRSVRGLRCTFDVLFIVFLRFFQNLVLKSVFAIRGTDALFLLTLKSTLELLHY